jgi:protein TonB
MDAKKTKRADLQSRRVVFLEAGIIIALAGVVGVFAWGSSEREVEVYVSPDPVTNSDVVVNTRSDPPAPKVKPMPVRALSEYIKVIRDNETVDVPNWIFPEPDDVLIPIKQDEEEVEAPPIYSPEVWPTFMGGDLNSFRNWVQSRLQYPAWRLKPTSRAK